MKNDDTLQGPFTIVADLDTPVSAFLKLASLKPRYLLESVEGGIRLARYSFIGFGEARETRIGRSDLWINGTRENPPATADELLSILRQALEDAPVLCPDDSELPFNGGLVGFSAYDMVRFFEPIGQRDVDDDSDIAAYVATDSLLIFDHLTRRIALLHAGSESERLELQQKVTTLLRGPLPAPHTTSVCSDPQASLSETEFCQAVTTAKAEIDEGNVYQLVCSVKFAGQFDGSAFDVYRALRLLNPSPYMFYCDIGGVKIAGSSPEALVRLNSGTASLRPIAGTRPRGCDRASDLELEAELKADPKELAEHVMLVDLARNDLGRVAKVGSIRVDPYMNIERYSHVMHIVSGVSGELAESRDAFDLFRAAFPAGTLVGAPKVSAMRLIDQLEPTSRGLYAGTVGYFGKGGDMDQAITIRSLVFTDGRYSFQAGAGIVADSDPAAEYQEVLHKSAILRRALAIASEGL